MKKAKSGFPDTVYVVRDIHDDGSYLETWEDAKDLVDCTNESTEVGIYKLSQTKTIKVTRELE